VDVSLLPKDPGLNDDDDDDDDDEGMHRALAAMEREEALGDEAQMARLRRILGEFKAPAIADIIADIIAEELKERQYSKIVVLAYHHSVLDTLRKKLSPFGVMGFDGSTPTQSRQFAIDVFRDDPSIRVFVAQQTAAGVAVNLQVASEIVLVEPSWSPDEDAQAIARIHRIGSTHACRARIFAVAGTLDEAMQRVRASKIKMQVSLGLRDGKDAA
jgi:SNF2 family DNA or RNA helicase